MSGLAASGYITILFMLAAVVLVIVGGQMLRKVKVAILREEYGLQDGPAAQPPTVSAAAVRVRARRAALYPAAERAVCTGRAAGGAACASAGRRAADRGSLCPDRRAAAVRAGGASSLRAAGRLPGAGRSAERHPPAGRQQCSAADRRAIKRNTLQFPTSGRTPSASCRFGIGVSRHTRQTEMPG